MSSTRKRSSKKVKLIDLDDPDKETRRKPVKRYGSNWKELQWTVNQKRRLLSAMMRFGCKDVDSIAKEFPEKTKTTVKNMISMLIRLSKNSPASTDNKKLLESWKETTLFSDKKSLIPSALKYISMFEKHPSLEDCGNCDLRALYRFLSNATLGRSALNTSLMTYETLWHVVENVSKDVMTNNILEIRYYIKHKMEEKQRILMQQKKHKSKLMSKTDVKSRNTVI